MRKIIVTGGSGKAGRATVRELLEHGYEVANLDLVPSPDPLAPYTHIDLTDFGQTMDALSGLEGRLGMRGAEAIVHLGAIPSSAMRSNEATFRINTISTYNVFLAATKLGFERVVWASSETALGFPFDRAPPAYVPLDEEAPVRPESSYALTKILGEEMAQQFSRWHPEIPFLGLRFSYIIEPGDYAGFPAFQDDPLARKWNLWSYVDARDVGQSCRRALEADVSGAEVFIIAAADTVTERAAAELMAEVFPTTPIRGEIGAHDTLISIEKARRMLGYEPRYSWRTHES